MIAKRVNQKGIIVKLLEQVIRLLLIKECKKISNIKIDILSNSTQVIKGEIQRINITAEDINYKDLLFDGIELEANQLKINFKLMTKELYFKNDPIIKFKISLSQNSLKKVLLSNNWNYIRDMISNQILNQAKLEDVKITNGQFLIKASKEDNTNKIEQIDIKTAKGKIYLNNRNHNKSIQIPIEEKIYIENVNIENDLIIFFAHSYISF